MRIEHDHHRFAGKHKLIDRKLPGFRNPSRMHDHQGIKGWIHRGRGHLDRLHVIVALQLLEKHPGTLLPAHHRTGTAQQRQSRHHPNFLLFITLEHIGHRSADFIFKLLLATHEAEKINVLTLVETGNRQRQENITGTSLLRLNPGQSRLLATFRVRSRIDLGQFKLPLGRFLLVLPQ